MDATSGDLSFGEINFASGGTYKACFCDYTLMSALDGTNRGDNLCTHASAFNIELGKVHVSGIQCLLEADYRKGTCTTSVDGLSLMCEP